ncbi:hypothetical protein BDB00DRAFT_868710 [Zychaea mexicana]|uniref:uncharacterized protein n=1 Tax=Zychaea mexicana TaxID=64656 RepID=UPI0022FF0AB5|nr:uncharacterized protein BDB00DRAFT_868710 [Zychaea mexicana]KAI9497260.1 hypothetical protein BDB00DRAFT_868710 [Zychaea mexicana]
MVYPTYFEGHIIITPNLPEELLNTVNALSSGINNVYGEGDTHSFDGIVHHLRGWPKPLETSFNSTLCNKHDKSISYFELKQYGVTKVPSNICHWILVNTYRNKLNNNIDDESDISCQEEERDEEVETTLQWNGTKNFYEYIFWMQYLVDFVTLYAKHQFNIDIVNFQGSIVWRGESFQRDSQEDCGTIRVERRALPEVTGFYPDDFLPLPTTPTNEEATRALIFPLRKIPLVIPPTPKGAPFKSLFGVKATISYRKPLQICSLGMLRVDGGVSRGQYALLLDKQPSKRDGATITFHLHHERSHAVYNKNDPEMKCTFSREERLEFGDQAYQEWFTTKAIATTMTPRRKELKNLAANMIVNSRQQQGRKDTATPQVVDELNSYIQRLKLSEAYRNCTGCGSLFEGPAYQIAAWNWPHGYAHAHAYAIYSPACSNGRL